MPLSEEQALSACSTGLGGAFRCLFGPPKEKKSNHYFMNIVRFGVVGTNFITDWMLKGASHESRFRLTAVSSRSEETARNFAQRYQVPHTFTRLEDMAQSPHIDAVYIATPNSLHAEQSLLFLRHGKHVLVEKPFATTAAEAEAMACEARAGGLVIMEAMKTTVTPNFIKLQQSLHRVGPVRRYFAAYCQYSSRYDKFKEGIVLNAFNPALGNGSLTDIGVYCLSPMVALFGMPQSVKSVSFSLSSGADGQGAALFTYPEMDAMVLYSKIADSALPSEIMGEAGTLRIPAINRFNGLTLRHRDGREEDLSEPHIDDDMYYEIKLFIDRVLQCDTTPNLNRVEQSVGVVQLLEEIMVNGKTMVNGK